MAHRPGASLTLSLDCNDHLPPHPQERPRRWGIIHSCLPTRTLKSITPTWNALLSSAARTTSRASAAPSPECLDSYCREHREKLALVDELSVSASNRPDGTVKDSLRMAPGLLGWPRTPTTTWTPKSEPNSTGATPGATSSSRTRRPPSWSRTATRRCGWICPGRGNCTGSSASSWTTSCQRSQQFRQAQSQFQDRPAHGAGEPAGHRRRGRGQEPALPSCRRIIPGAVPKDHRPCCVSSRRAGNAAAAHPDQGHLPASVR